MDKIHKGRITVAIIAGIGILASLFPWFEIWVKGMERGFVYDLGVSLEYGFQSWYGLLSIILFVIIIAFALIGTKGRMIAKGFPKMVILVMSGLLLVEALILLTVAGFSEILTAQAGIYIVLVTSLATAAAPYLFKADGTVELPSVNEVIDDIEDSADIVEDKFEELGDKIEDRFDGDDIEDAKIVKTDEVEAKAESKEEPPINQTPS